MAPKAKPKAKGKARPRAKAKAAPRVVMRRGVLRRPAGAPPPVPAPGLKERWMAKEEIDAHLLPLEELGSGLKVVVARGTYFTADCQAAGTIESLTVESGEVHLALKLTGTTNENLLRHQTGNVGKAVRLHRCSPSCTGERVADDLIHVSRMRLMGSREEEDGWTHNLVAVDSGDDELKNVRARADARDPAAVDKPERVVKAKEKRSKSPKKKSNKRGRSPKKKKKKRKRSRSRRRKRSNSSGRKEVAKEKKEVVTAKAASSSSSSSTSVKLDGRHARGAATKTLTALYAGTGLDPKERVRKRVIRRARKIAKKTKSGKSSGSSHSTEGSEASPDEEISDLGLFDPETRLQRVAELFPGVLTSQALKGMRSNLLQSIGSDDRAGPPRQFRWLITDNNCSGGPRGRCNES